MNLVNFDFRSGETLTITAKSSDVLFYPSSVEVFVSGGRCSVKAVQF